MGKGPDSLGLFVNRRCGGKLPPVKVIATVSGGLVALDGRNRNTRRKIMKNVYEGSGSDPLILKRGRDLIKTRPLSLFLFIFSLVRRGICREMSHRIMDSGKRPEKGVFHHDEH